MRSTIPKPLRCAIYTRKSTEHSLDLAFNSLDAQREACEAYVKSQAEHAMSEKPNTAIAAIGIDIGKNSFHMVGLDERGAITLREKWSRGQVETRLAKPAALPDRDGSLRRSSLRADHMGASSTREMASFRLRGRSARGGMGLGALREHGP